MIINKIGKYHIDEGKNCQDAGASGYAESTSVKIVCDGCGSCPNSEVGANLFVDLFVNDEYFVDCNSSNIERKVDEIYNKFFSLYDVSGDKEMARRADFLYKYFIFTILVTTEHEDYFDVNYCGDGYIITQKHDNTIEFIELDNVSGGGFTDFYVYNYFHAMNRYSDIDMKFRNMQFSKSEYKNVGVATDGLRFIVDAERYTEIYNAEELLSEFKDLLIAGKASAINRFINRNANMFKDDITIAF